MKAQVFLIVVCIMIAVALVFIFSQDASLKKKETPEKEIILQQETEEQNSLRLFFQVNSTNETLNGDLFIDGQPKGITQNGSYFLQNYSQFPENITLRIKYFELHYAIPLSFKDLSVLRLIVSQEEYRKYSIYQALQAQDTFSHAVHEHWNHMPLTYTTNFSEYADSKIREDKERKVRYALERLQNAVPSVSFQRVSNEEEADINFRGEIPSKVREANRPDGNANIAALALHNATGNIIFHGTVYLPLPTEGEDCPSSDVALHELLHTFSLPHSNNAESVLWDTASCTNNKILEEDAALLKSIYG